MSILITAVAQGSAGNGIQVKIVNSGGHNLPFFVSVVGKVITCQMQTNAAGLGNGKESALIALINSTPAAVALVTASLSGGDATITNATSTTTSGGTTSQNILYVRFQWPNGRYTSNIRVDHTVCYAPFNDDTPSATSNVGSQIPRPIRIEPVPCIPGTDIGIEVENRSSLGQSAFAAMIEFRGRLRRFLKSA
jgi:hypothetical protein